MSTQIIPYSNEALRWHLSNNVMNLTDYSIDNIIEMCNKVNRGELDLDKDQQLIGCTVSEMLEDLKIEYLYE